MGPLCSLTSLSPTLAASRSPLLLRHLLRLRSPPRAVGTRSGSSLLQWFKPPPAVGIRSGFTLLQRNKLAGEAWKCFSSGATMESPADVQDPAKGVDNGGTVETSGEGPLLKLEDLNWDHSFVRELPGDPRTDIIPREVLHACYTRISPSAEVENPELVAWSNSVAKLLDLDTKDGPISINWEFKE